MGLGLVGVHMSAQVDYNDPAYLYWEKTAAGALDIGRYLVLCASLAPSPHNTQPWKYEISGNQISIFADRNRSLGRGDKANRMMLMSIGCALENMRIAANFLGYHAEVNLLANSDFDRSGLCAQLVFSSLRQSQNQSFFDAIFKRQTLRSPYSPGPLPSELISSLSSLNRFPFLSLRWFSEPSELNLLAGLNSEAVRTFVNDEAYLDSLKWWRYTREEMLSKRDGISIFTSAAPSLIKQYFQWMVDEEMMQGEFGRKGEVDAMEVLFKQTPMWGAISSKKHDYDAKINAGQLVERLYLETTRQGFGLMPLSYLSEQESMAKKMQDTFNLQPGRELLFVFRLGQGEALERSVRRPLSDIIV